MKLQQLISPILALPTMLLLTPAATRPLLAEAPLPQEVVPTAERNTQVGQMPVRQTRIRMSVQRFTPPSYVYAPLPEQPTTANFWQQVGHNAALAQDYTNAVVAFDKALELAVAGRTDLYVQRGWAHYLNQSEAEAIADLQRAASLYLDDQAFDRYLNTQRMVGFIANQDVASVPSAADSVASAGERASVGES